MNTEEMTQVIDLDEVCQLLTNAGIPAYVEQTGGGCQTIYVGPWYRDADTNDEGIEGDQLPAWMVGPGWREGGIAYGWLEEVSLGDGFGSDRFYLETTHDDTAETFAAKCVAFIETNAAALTEYASEEGGYAAYNGIG